MCGNAIAARGAVALADAFKTSSETESDFVRRGLGPPFDLSVCPLYSATDEFKGLDAETFGCVDGIDFGSRYLRITFSRIDSSAVTHCCWVMAAGPNTCGIVKEKGKVKNSRKEEAQIKNYLDVDFMKIYCGQVLRPTANNPVLTREPLQLCSCLYQ
jgi:hypothetical protein